MLFVGTSRLVVFSVVSYVERASLSSAALSAAVPYVPARVCARTYARAARACVRAQLVRATAARHAESSAFTLLLLRWLAPTM